MAMAVEGGDAAIFAGGEDGVIRRLVPSPGDRLEATAAFCTTVTGETVYALYHNGAHGLWSGLTDGKIEIW